MAKLLLEFTFSEEEDHGTSSYKNLKLQTITRRLEEGMTEDDASNLAEIWAQSDYYHVGVHNALLTAIGDGRVTADDLTIY